MAHSSPDDKNFVDPGKVPMPAWRTILIVIYTIYLLASGFIVGKVKKLLAGKTNVKAAKK